MPEGVAALVGASLISCSRARGRRAINLSEASEIDGGVVSYGGGFALGVCPPDRARGVGGAGSPASPITAGWAPLESALVRCAVETTSTRRPPPDRAVGSRSRGRQPAPWAGARRTRERPGILLPVSTPCNAIVYGGLHPSRADKAACLLDAWAVVVTGGPLVPSSAAGPRPRRSPRRFVHAVVSESRAAVCECADAVAAQALKSERRVQPRAASCPGLRHPRIRS